METGGAQACIAALSSSEPKSVLRAVAAPNRLARDLMRMVDEALAEMGWSPGDLELIAAAIGPGSWTGLRIGLSAAKTLAQTLECPLVGVPTFDALARAAWSQTVDSPVELDRHLLLTAMTCRAGELYAQLYECSGDYLVRVQPAWIATPRQLADTVFVESLSRGIEGVPILAGPGSVDVGSLLAEQGESPLFVEIDSQAMCLELAQAGMAVLEAGSDSDPLALQPLYLAPSAAERNLSRK